MRKNCLINPDISKKLKEVMNIIHLQNEINILYGQSTDLQDENLIEQTNDKIYRVYEKLGDSYCNIGLYDLGLNSYYKQVCFS